MPCARDIKRRIQSIKSTQQITKAMKMVSAAKLYKSQKYVLAKKPYSEQLHRLFSKLIRISGKEENIKLLQRREINNTAVLLVTGNRGLAGGFNHNLVRIALSERSGNTEFIAVGSKGRDALISAGCPIADSFCDIGDFVTFKDVRAIGDLVLSAYESGKYDCIKLVYHKFISAGRQEPCLVTLLPISADVFDDGHSEELEHGDEYIFEGDALEILDNLSKKYVYNSILQAVMESKTGEHIARMIAMNSATDNASEMMKQLKMDYNRSRQAAITREIAEISNNANAVL